jgi:hypothetical protein
MLEFIDWGGGDISIQPLFTCAGSERYAAPEIVERNMRAASALDRARFSTTSISIPIIAVSGSACRRMLGSHSSAAAKTALQPSKYVRSTPSRTTTVLSTALWCA